MAAILVYVMAAVLHGGCGVEMGSGQLMMYKMSLSFTHNFTAVYSFSQAAV